MDKRKLTYIIYCYLVTLSSIIQFCIVNTEGLSFLLLFPVVTMWIGLIYMMMEHYQKDRLSVLPK